MSAANRVLFLVLLAVGAWSGFVFLMRGPVRRPAPAGPSAYVDPVGLDRIHSVTILSFYASPGQIVEGEHATLCYGVALASSVRLNPPVERLSPSLNRCISVSPVEDTRYTLTAEGRDGSAVTESFLLHVTPDPTVLPKVTTFVAEKKTVDRGQAIYSLCFQVENALRVRVEPPVIPEMAGAPRGCFYVAPPQGKATYTLIAEGRHGAQAKRQVTVP
jgi:hypothetical protein